MTKPDITIRRATPAEHGRVRAVVQTVVDETYGGLWAPPPLPIDDEDWSLAWVAIVDQKIADAELAGMVLTHADWVSDLWVLRQFRTFGAGSGLLARAEDEIAERGYASARLRLVRGNARALAFYRARGWEAQREFPHEYLPITMIEMAKGLPGPR